MTFYFPSGITIVIKNKDIKEFIKSLNKEGIWFDKRKRGGRKLPLI